MRIQKLLRVCLGVGIAFLGTGGGCSPSPDEGPWLVKSGGAEIGRVFATEPTSGTWNEYIERRASGWAWPSSTVSWELSVPSGGYGSSTQPTCSGAAYQACQRTQAQVVGTASTPSEWFSPSTATTSASVDVAEYYAIGRYQILASYTTSGASGAPVTYKADFYVSAGLAGDIRQERLCAEPGFAWPDSSGSGRSGITWTISWVGAGGPKPCPAGWTLHRYTIDLDP